MKHMESLQNTQVKLQGDRPSPETPPSETPFLPVRLTAPGSPRMTGPQRVNVVESGAICSKNGTFEYFDGTAWTPRLRSPIPIMVSVAT